MANDRDIDINLVGHDRTRRATNSAEGNINRLGNRIRGFTGRVAESTAGTRKFVAAIAAAGSILPAVVAVTVKAAIAVAKYAAEIAPAAAALLPLAAGAKLVQMTVMAAGPAMGKAISPVTKAWEKQTAVIGKLSSKGLRPLARDFVRLNFPAINKATSSIATSVNLVADGYLRWTKTSPGMKVIKDITAGTAGTVKRLSPLVLTLATSLSELAGRAEKPAFKNFGDAAEYVLKKIIKLVEGISAKDVAGAFKKIGETAKIVAGWIRKIGDALQWMDEHKAVVDAVRTAFALLAIVFGGPVTAILGIISLIILYWDNLKVAFDKAKGWLKGVSDKFHSLKQPMDAIKGLIKNVKDGFHDFIEGVAPSVGPAIDRIKDAWIRMQPYISLVITWLGTLIGVFLKIAGPIVGKVITGLSLLIEAFSRVAEAVATMVAFVLEQFAAMIKPIAWLAKKLHLPFAKELGEFGADAKAAADKIRKNLAEAKTDLAIREVEKLRARIKTLKGKKVKTEADKAEIAASIAKIKQLQGQIDSVRGKTVQVGVIFYQKGKAPSPHTYGKGLGVMLSGGMSFQAVEPGGMSRTGGPAPVNVTAGDVNVDSRVFLDGKVIASVARSVISDSTSRAAYRARAGRR